MAFINQCREYMIRIDKDRNNQIQHDKGIRDELEKLQGLPEEIVDGADEVHRSMISKTTRSKRRVLHLTFTILAAYQERMLPFNPTQIANMVPDSTPKNKNTNNNKTKNVNKRKKKRVITFLATAISKRSPIQTGYEAPFLAYDPRMFILIYCRELVFTQETTQDVLEFAKKILYKAPSLFSDSPVKIASGIINYYVTVHGINVTPEMIGTIAGISAATMSDIYNKISLIDNK